MTPERSAGGSGERRDPYRLRSAWRGWYGRPARSGARARPHRRRPGGRRTRRVLGPVRLSPRRAVLPAVRAAPSLGLPGSAAPCPTDRPADLRLGAGVARATATAVGSGRGSPGLPARDDPPSPVLAPALPHS